MLRLHSHALKLEPHRGSTGVSTQYELCGTLDAGSYVEAATGSVGVLGQGCSRQGIVLIVVVVEQLLNGLHN